MLQSVVVPDSLSAAQSALVKHGRARIISGGTVVMPAFNHGTDDFDVLVSLRKAGLAGIALAGGKVSIGAATSLSALQARPELDFLSTALDSIGSPTIRNMATVGGNLFVEQPYGDLAVCLIALGATATIAGGRSFRVEPVETLTQKGVERGEIVTEVSFALPPTGAFRFAKATRRAFNSASIVTVAAVAQTAGGVVSHCSIALGGVARHAVRARAVERALAGKPFDRAHVEAAANTAGSDIDPFDDAYASAWYRARVTPVHIRRALLGA